MVRAIALLLLLAPLSAQAVVHDGIISLIERGQIRTFPSRDYVVVRRQPRKKPVPIVKPTPCPVVTPAPCPVEYRIRTVRELLPNKKNRVRALGGIGPNGLELETSKVSVYQGVIGGIGYDRLLTSRISIGAQALTNRTFTLGVGFDF